MSCKEWNLQRPHEKDVSIHETERLFGIQPGKLGRDKINKSGNSILDDLKTIVTVTSTVLANGDINPYGVAEVTRTTGNLTVGHILVTSLILA